MVLQKKIHLQLCAHHRKAFELAEAMLSKTKTQRVVYCIESEGISENSEGFLQKDGGVCPNPKILCLSLNSSIWNLYKSPTLEAKSVVESYWEMLNILNILIVL